MYDRLSRRTVLRAAGASAVAIAGCSGVTNSGNSESFPAESINLVVPFSTGGGFDAYARISQSYWETYIGNEASVVVENVEGAGGRTGATQVYNEGENPHSMLFWYPSAAIPPQLVSDVGYDIFAMPPIGAMVRDPNAMVLRSSAGIDSFETFVERAPELTFATQGVGSAAHTVTLMFAAITGTVSPDELSFVHYNGTSEAQAGLARGEVNAMIVGTVSSAAQVGNALDDAELFTVFSTPETGERYADQTRYFSSEVSGVPELERYAELTQFVRMLVAPPEAPEDAVETLRSAFDQLVEDEQFLAEATDRGRPVTNPGDHQALTSILDGRREVYSSDALRSVFEETF